MPSPPPSAYVDLVSRSDMQKMHDELVARLTGVLQETHQETVDKHAELQTALCHLSDRMQYQGVSLDVILSRISSEDGVAPKSLLPNLLTTSGNESVASSPFRQENQQTRKEVESGSKNEALPAWQIPAKEQEEVSLKVEDSTLRHGKLAEHECKELLQDQAKEPKDDTDAYNENLQKARSRHSTLLALEECDGTRTVRRSKRAGLFGLIAESRIFQTLSAVMICLNAIYLGIATDWNKSASLSSSPWPFQAAEHIFTTFFTVEVCITFCAFRNKMDCLTDKWWMLDFVMVLMMVCDTWLFTLALAITGNDNAPDTGVVGGIGRMFRLLRLARISKLMHVLPELATMVKAMITAVRAVHVALLILILQVYVFAIIMNVLIGDEQEVHQDFGSVSKSMVTLLLSGVLLDNISVLVWTLISVGNIWSVVAFAVFVLLSAFTVMNMLIGVLCQVILDVSTEEKENHIKEHMQDTLLVMLQNLDEDGSGCLSKSEVTSVIQDPEAYKVLSDIQVDTEHLLDVIEMLYDTEDAALPISTFMSIVLSMRGRRPVTMNDLAKGYNFLLSAFEAQFDSHLDRMKTALDHQSANLEHRIVNRPRRSSRCHQAFY